MSREYQIIEQVHPRFQRKVAASRDLEDFKLAWRTLRTTRPAAQVWIEEVCWEPTRIHVSRVVVLPRMLGLED